MSTFAIVDKNNITTVTMGGRCVAFHTAHGKYQKSLIKKCQVTLLIEAGKSEAEALEELATTNPSAP